MSEESRKSWFTGETIKYLTQEETKRFFKTIKEKRDKALFLTIYKYGLRVSEALNIRLEDVDFERGRIFIRRLKNGISGEYRLFKDVEKALGAYLRQKRIKSQYAFTGREGPLSRFAVSRLFKKYAQRAEISEQKQHVHVLRHSIATHLLDDNWGIEAVRDALGHKNIQSTVIYARITSKKRDKLYQDLEERRSPAVVWID